MTENPMSMASRRPPAPAPRHGAEAQPRPLEVGVNPHLIVQAVETVVKGHRRAVALAVTAMLAEGHVLIEDVPGVGKTTMAMALGKAVDAPVSRIQFTPDLLPSDIVGVSVFRPQSGTFEFTRGPVFASIVIADEINRASPKTQSALLESMQEGRVTVDGVTYPLGSPFMVLATQNPYDMEGTYPLPEAQRDRFMMRMSLGYPDYDNEVAMLDSQELTDPMEQIVPVANAEQIRGLIRAFRGIHASSQVKRYIVDLARATRQSLGVRRGVSPRAGIQLLRAAKAWAGLAGRRFVLPDDVQAMCPHVWGHRLSWEGSDSRHAHEAIRDLLGKVKVR